MVAAKEVFISGGILEQAELAAAVKKIDDDQAVKELEDYLSKNAKRATSGEKTEEDVPAEEAA